MGSRYGQQPGQGDDPMAYGEYPGRSNEPPADEYEGQEGERGIVGDTYRKLRTEYQQYNSSGKPSGTGAQGGGGGGLGGFLFGKLQDAVGDIGNELKMKLDKPGSHTHTHATTQCDDGVHSSTNHRYGSFAPQRTGDDAKWYVDGCSYFWAVSLALERATESIWILDCKYVVLKCSIVFGIHSIFLFFFKAHIRFRPQCLTMPLLLEKFCSDVAESVIRNSVAD